MTSRWEIIVGRIDPTMKQSGKYLRPIFKDKGGDHAPVSYTHLTLPTNREV